MKIFWTLGQATSTKYLVPLMKGLIEKGIDLHVFAISRTAKNVLDENAIKSTFIPAHFDYEEPIDIDGKLSLIEANYGIISTNKLIYNDVEATRMNRDKAKRLLYKYLVFWINTIQKEKPDGIIGGIERFHYQSCYEISQHFNVPYFIEENYIPLRGKFSLSRVRNGVYEIPEKLVSNWESIKDRSLSAAEKKAAEELLDSETQTVKTHLVYDSTPRILSISKFKFFIKMAYHGLIVEKNKYPTINVFNGTKTYLLKAIRSRTNRIFYSKPNYNDKIIFFPLHDPLDAQLLVSAPHYEDQYLIIRTLAKSMPAGYRLYVKEHPNSIGLMKHKDMKMIAALPDVKVIEPKIPAKTIIKNSRIVTVINSRAGWEGIMLGKPVVSFGRNFYEISGLCFPVRDHYKIPQVLKDAEKNNPVEREKVLKFIAAMMKTNTRNTGRLPSNLFFENKVASDNEIIGPEIVRNKVEGYYQELVEQIKK